MFCNTEKAWLSQRGVTFTEWNVAQDEAALAELEKLEVFSTPATLVVGSNRRRLEELLGLTPYT